MVAITVQLSQVNARYGSDGGGLPVGRHKVIIENTVQTPTKDNQGNYLAIILKSIEGPSAGVVHTDRLNLWNINPKTVEIANQQLAAYADVTKQRDPRDTAQLHNIPFIVEIGQQKNNPDFTEVKKLFDINGNEPGKAAGPAQAPVAPQAPPQGFAPVGGGFVPPQLDQQGGAAAWSTGPAQVPQAPQPPQPPQQAAWGAPAQSAAPAAEPAPWAQQQAAAGPATQPWAPSPGGSAPGWGAR